MASSAKGLRLLKTLDLLKAKLAFDTTTVIKKMQLDWASDGALKGSFKVEPDMCNYAGTLHGGYIASVVDVCSFYSQLSHPKGRISWTIAMNVIYLGIAKEGETVNVETKPLKIGNSSIMETYFHSADTGRLLAKGTTNFLIAEKLQNMLKDCHFDVYEQ